MSDRAGDRGAALEVLPLTADRWDDFERLFGPSGACGGCWCMWFRLTNREFSAAKGEANRRAMCGLVAAGRVPGILACRDGEPVGWCSVAPREEFPRLARSRILKPVDDVPVWSVVCLFVARQHRRSGVSVALLRAAVDHVAACGGSVVEGYAVSPRKAEIPDLYGYHGLVGAYRSAGFVEVARRSETRPIMRCVIGDAPAP